MAADRRDADTAANDLRMAVGRIARRLRQLYAEQGTTSDLAFTEASVLLRLQRQGPSSPSLLADVENVTPQAVGSVLTALEAEGFVKRQPHPRDGRRITVELTARGRRALNERGRAVTRHIERVLEQDLNAKERRELLAALPLLERIADRL